MAISKIENNSLASGVPSTANLPAGTVLQVVNFKTNSQTVTSSTSYVATALTLSITPSSATSKILVFGNVFVTATQNNTQPIISLFRNGSDLLSGTGYGFGDIYSASGGYAEAIFPFSYLDSPATTSSVTYTIYGRAAGGSAAYFSDSLRTSVITAMEIAA